MTAYAKTPGNVQQLHLTSVLYDVSYSFLNWSWLLKTLENPNWLEAARKKEKALVHYWYCLINDSQSGYWSMVLHQIRVKFDKKRSTNNIKKLIRIEKPVKYLLKYIKNETNANKLLNEICEPLRHQFSVINYITKD